MQNRLSKGFSLIELFVVIVLISLLTTILLPGLSYARSRAKLTVCLQNLASAHRGLVLYTSTYEGYFPPFAFYSVASTDLALSGHWCGADSAVDPFQLGRLGTKCVNFGLMFDEDMLRESTLLCPGASAELESPARSFFHYTRRFSTYSLRFPESEDLFDASPGLKNIAGSLLGVYKIAAGGQWLSYSGSWQQVPLIRDDHRYNLADGCFDPAGSVLLADTFCQEEFQAKAPSTDAFDVQRGLCHQQEFNVLSGCGAARTVRDAGTVLDYARSGGSQSPADVWAYFEATH